MKKVFIKIATFAPALALLMAITSASAACYSFYHQPDMPAGLKKYEK